MAGMIYPDEIDFDAYLHETDAQQKVRPASEWVEELIARIENPTRPRHALMPWRKTHKLIQFRPGEVTLWGGANGGGNPQYAADYMAKAKARGEMTGDDLLKLQGHVNTATWTNQANQAVQLATTSVMPAIAPSAMDRMAAITAQTESGNRDFAKDGSLLQGPATRYGTAKGSMQVLDGTAQDPGFGVKPAQDGSAAERARVGRDYLQALVQRYDGDPAKAWAAEVADIEARVLTELNALGRFNAKVNEQYAALMGSYFSTMAARAGISPAEFARTYALQFSRDAAPEGSMDQAAGSLGAVRQAWDDAGIKHSMSESGDLITLSQIIVPESERGSGKGTAAMQALVDYADATGKHIALSPSGDFGGNKKRLVQFYKRFGFVENKGKNRAFTTSESMHREAPGKVLYQDAITEGAFGPVFEGLENQPAQAIDKLLAAKAGEVPGAFHHPELGPIALVYGNEHFGLAHIEARRGAEFLQQLPDIVATGRVVRDASGLPRVYLVKDGEPAHVAVVRLDWDGEQKTWVVTAYRDHNGKFAGGEKTSDTSAQNSPEVPTGEGGAVFSQETGPDSVSTAMQEFKQAARAQISMGDDITSQPSVMSLLENADWSSFIHESGHFFLEVQADLASRIAGRAAQGEAITEGEQSLLDDFNATLNWFGISGTPDLSALATWLTMSTDERRPYHEKWARGFEAYAFEGKAPSLDLQKAFQTFRAWLLSIYKRLSALNVQLTDEVREVMGRMLATADQISEAEAARNLGPLFATPEQGGMTPEEYRAYHDLSTQATLEAADTLQTKALRDMGRAKKAPSPRPRCPP